MRQKLTHNTLGMLIPVTLLLCLGSVSGKICESNQFWSSFLSQCKNCSVCVKPDIVIRPCQGHRDTICGPLSSLKIDWSWMKHTDGNGEGDAEKEMTQTFKENMEEIRLHELHVQAKEKVLNKLRESHSLEESDNEFDEDVFKSSSKQDLWNKLKELGRERDLHRGRMTDELLKLHKPRLISEDPKIFEIPYDPDPFKDLRFNDEEGKELLKTVSSIHLKGDTEEFDGHFDGNHLKLNEKNVLDKHFGFFPVIDGEDDTISVEPVDHQRFGDFSMTERFVLDWQTGILAMAITSCLVFFLVALCYSLSYLRQWKTVQNHFYKDVEELKAWLKPKKSNLPCSEIYKTTTEVVHKEAGSGHCKYLERIISKNAKKKFNRVPGNVYQGAHPCVETRPLTAEDPAIHKSLRV